MFLDETVDVLEDLLHFLGKTLFETALSDELTLGSEATCSGEHSSLCSVSQMVLPVITLDVPLLSVVFLPRAHCWVKTIEFHCYTM